jgi:hypothetical protein
MRNSVQKTYINVKRVFRKNGLLSARFSNRNIEELQERKEVTPLLGCNLFSPMLEKTVNAIKYRAIKIRQAFPAYTSMEVHH